MNKQEYDQTQRHLLLQAQTIYALFDNLDEFIDAINKAESIGPIVDAKVYRDGNENMQRIKAIAKAVRKCRKEIREPLQYLIEHQEASNS